MKPSDEERDALTDEYRQASAAEAGRPGASVRKAILEEAAAAARRRRPAANDARYLWRGAAGVAVLGFAILMWKQVDHRIPGDAPVVAAQSESKTEVTLEEASPPQQSVAPAPQMRAAEAESSAQAMVSRDMANAMQGAPAAPAMAPAPEPFRNESARTLGKMSAAQDAEVDADALLRLHFPRQYLSDMPHTVWLVEDGTGAVLRSGELAAGMSFTDIRPGIERELGGKMLRPWRIRSLQNARGQTIQLGIAQTP